ncbi:MAG: NHLP family bacteriocin export ABC transporter peptidase/permease/ATPase, partial [Clostridia bacterium]|nr:NHLP family bacteriocin export ABC transporter peptidase/permease/ATPase [Clostridia bacterium]
MSEKKKIPQPVTGAVAKVPVVMQMEALECGAASLAMVLAYYKRFIPLEQMRTDCGVSRDGSSAKNILRAARNHGMQAKALPIDCEGLKKSGKFPCIIHWNYNHFVVLDGFKKDAAVLNDPARGCVRVSMQEFEKAYTGIYLELVPTEAFEPAGKPQSIFRFARERLKGSKTAIIFVVLTTIITALISTIKPAFSRVFLDRILGAQQTDWLMPLLGAMLALAALEFIAGCINSIYSLKIEGKLAIISNSTFMWHILRLPMQFYAQRMAGDIADRQRKNESVAKELIRTLAPVVLHAFLAILYFVIMLSYSVPLALISLAATLINLFVARVISRQKVNVTRVQTRDAGKLAGFTVTGIEMMETIKASGAENGYFGRWAGFQASVNTQDVKYAQINQMLGVVPELVSTLADCLMLAIGIFLVLNGAFTVGIVTAFKSVMGLFQSPVRSLIEAGQKLQEMRTNMERIQDVMTYEPDISTEAASEDPSVADDFSKLTGEVELRNITFGYSPLAEPLIKDFSMKLRPGS